MLNRLLERANALAPRTGLAHGLLIAAILTVAVVYRFGPSAPRVFFGDDLWVYLKFLDGKIGDTYHSALFDHLANKYRPVPHLLIVAMLRNFGAKYLLYICVAFFVQILCGLMFYRIAMRLTRREVLISLIVTLAFVLSRLGHFHVALFIGVIESTAVLAFLVAVYGSLLLTDSQTEDRERTRGVILVLAGTCLAIFSHERFFAITPWAMLVLLFSPATRTLRTRARVGLALVPLIAVIVNVLMKIYVVDIPVALGTGMTALQFDLVRIMSFLREALLTLAGFNAGPSYLVARVPEGLSDPLTWVGVVFIVSWSAVVLAAIFRAATVDPLCSIYSLCVLAFAGLILLAPAVSTIRLEQRWLYTSFAMTLAILAWSFGRLRDRHRVAATLGVLIVFGSLVTMDSLIRRHWDSYYLYAAARVSAALIEVKDQLPKEGRIVLIIHPDACGFAVQEGAIFRVYGNGSRKMSCYYTIDDYRKDRRTDDSNDVFVYNVASHRFIATKID